MEDIGSLRDKYFRGLLGAAPRRRESRPIHFIGLTPPMDALQGSVPVMRSVGYDGAVLQPLRCRSRDIPWLGQRLVQQH